MKFVAGDFYASFKEFWNKLFFDFFLLQYQMLFVFLGVSNLYLLYL